MKKIIVIDMQVDFVTGSLGTDNAQKIIPNIINRLNEYEPDEKIFTRDTHEKNYLETLEGIKLPVVHCVKDSFGWQVIPELDLPDTHKVDKETFGSIDLPLYITNELHRLQKFNKAEKVDSIELCGVCTDICVISNALILRAYFPNTQIIVHADCCAGATPELHEAALKVMESCQIDIIR